MHNDEPVAGAWHPERSTSSPAFGSRRDALLRAELTARLWRVEAWRGGAHRLEQVAAWALEKGSRPDQQRGRSRPIGTFRVSEPTPGEAARFQQKLLAGHRVLLVEDDHIVGDDVRGLLEEAGAEVVGPVADLNQALALARSGAYSLAIIEAEIAGASAQPVAETLERAGTPFLFHTGAAKHRKKLWPRHEVSVKVMNRDELLAAARAARAA